MPSEGARAGRYNSGSGEAEGHVHQLDSGAQGVDRYSDKNTVISPFEILRGEISNRNLI